MAVGVAEEGLLARGGELHRAAGLQREQPEGQLEALVLAVGGGAGHTGDDDLDLVLLEAERGGGGVPVAVRVGGRQVQLDAPVRAGHGEPGLGPYGGGVLAADAVQPLDDDLADRVRVAVAQRDVPDQVAVGVQRLGLERLLGVGHRVEHLVLDDDRGGGHARGVRVVGGDGGQRLAVVAYDLGGEDRAVGRAAAEHRGAGDVLVGDDRADAGHLERVRGVDRLDARVRVRGAQHGGPQQALGPQVGGVREGALGLGARVGGREGGAEPAREGLLLGSRLGGLHGGCLVAHAWPPSWP